MKHVCFICVNSSVLHLLLRLYFTDLVSLPSESEEVCLEELPRTCAKPQNLRIQTTDYSRKQK